MSSMMENMICRSAKDCLLVATLMDTEGAWKACGHREIHEEDRSCKPDMCPVTGLRVNCMEVE